MLEVKNLSFAYARRCVWSDVSFQVSSGTCVALTGANGAGKTTLLRVLAGLAAPTQGQILLDGFDTRFESLRFHRLLGYMPEHPVAEEDLRVGEYLKYRAKLKGERFIRIRRRVNEAIARLHLEEIAKVPLRRLSPGQMKRVAAAEALLLRPRVLLADDPFAGADEASCEVLVDVLRQSSQHAVVLVTGHDRALLGRVASRTLHLSDGQMTEVACA